MIAALASLGWPWTKPLPPPPPPPPHLIEAHASLIGVLLCLAGPLCFYVALGPPLKPDAPKNRVVVTKMDWPGLASSAARQSKGVFMAFVVAFLVMRSALRFATGNAPTAGAVTSGEQVVGEAASLAADIMAYNVVSLVFACLSCAIGLREWFGPIQQIGGTPLERFYGRSELAERLCRLTAGYECFNIVAVVLLPEYRTAAFIGHHVTTCFLGVLSMHPWCHYYSTFFFGVASLSSVPLCVGELFNAAGLEAAVELSKPPFVLLFLLLRTAYWPYVSLGFWQDSLWALAKPRERVHSVGAFATLLSANVFLTGLQVLWTGQICAAVGEALSGT